MWHMEAIAGLNSPSVSTVAACWHPPVTAQDGSNPGERIHWIVIRGVESLEEKILNIWEEGGRQRGMGWDAMQV